jgi:hypothetical protein
MVDLCLVVEWSHIWNASKNRTNLSDFQMAKTRWWLFENRTNTQGFFVLTSLDCFINKMAIKRIFFIIKQFSFVVFENQTNLVEPGIWKPDHSKTRPKKCSENVHLKTGLSGFRLFTVLHSEYFVSNIPAIISKNNLTLLKKNLKLALSFYNFQRSGFGAQTQPS